MKKLSLGFVPGSDNPVNIAEESDDGDSEEEEEDASAQDDFEMDDVYEGQDSMPLLDGVNKGSSINESTLIRGQRHLKDWQILDIDVDVLGLTQRKSDSAAIAKPVGQKSGKDKGLAGADSKKDDEVRFVHV